MFFLTYAIFHLPTDTSNLNSNCNCDKTDNNCKCGTQKADLSVPNIRQDYSDYMENPDKEVEKKSVKHCNCDKNGKHCKCQSLSEESQYIDNVEQQPSSIEKKSPDLYEGNAVDEFENDIEERVPRRPRQRSSMENSNLEHLSEDYNKNYETKSDKLTKRESEQNKVRDNQQFENGEYFVDLHPNIYR